MSVGYADGFLRAASASDARPGAEAIVAGQRCPIAGRVSMDLIAVDVTDLPRSAAQRGDLVTLLGDGIGVDDLAARAGTIGYEVLTSLGRRYRRVYRPDPLFSCMFLYCSHRSAMVPAPSRRIARRGNRAMAKNAPSFICQNCGAVYGRWQGKCEACGEWNTIAEEGAAADRAVPGRSARKGRVFALEPLAGETHDAPRLPSGMPELDRVTGGGFVRGSVLLIGRRSRHRQIDPADPGRGRAARRPATAPSISPARKRSRRCGCAPSGSASANAPVELAAETSVEDIIATLSQGKTPRLVVIDSIQTMWTDAVESAPGTVTQVRGSAQALIRFAKRSGAAVILVGHVTKDGQIAGPRVVEHMVDAVLSFEGDGAHQFRILRAVKNRFGPTDEIGVFEMTGAGLREVPNPSELFLSERDLGSPGTAVFAGIEGTRPLLVEIQALVAPTSLGTPRRAVVGWDPSRLSMVLAVLEAHCGVKLGGHDVYLNVAGGLRIQEPAADLAAAAALVSSLAGARCRPMRSISARCRCPARSARWRRPPRG